MAHTVTLIAGDGVGPEIADAVQRVFEAAGAPVVWDEQPLNESILAQTSGGLPPALVESVQRNRVALKGPLTTPIGTGYTSLNLVLRKTFDLYANLRPAKTMAGVKSRYENIDLLVVRENTEGEYSGLEHEVVPGVVESLKVITRKASERIARFAFQLARSQNRKNVTAVHKANIMKKSDGLFLECCRSIAKQFPEIAYGEMIVDNTCLQLVLNPQKFDVMVLPNLYGDIVSDLCAGLVGGLGVAPSGNIGAQGAIFEAVHGSAPDIAGKGLANPTALLLSGVMMLRHLGELEVAARIEAAVQGVVREGKQTTRDLGGDGGTTQMTEAIVRTLKA
jgi:isocitrate dehydrogenase (NAD+)